jgi:hypothetical protein
MLKDEAEKKMQLKKDPRNDLSQPAKFAIMVVRSG